MDNLRAVVKNLFSRISPYEILKGNTIYDHLDENTFLQLGSGYIMNYSNDELRNMYYFLENEFLWYKRKMKNELLESSNEGSGFNVFDALLLFNNAVLIEENGEPKCQYVQLLRWRDVVTELEEDLFVTSFFAYHDLLFSKNRNNFFWKPVIENNNYELKRLLKQGMAENHFHLKGSAPGFHLAWISLMNQIDNIVYQRRFEEYEKKILRRKREYRGNYKGGRLVYMWRQAALIRLFLFSIIKDTYLKLDYYQIFVKDLQDICNETELEELRDVMTLNRGDKTVNLENIKECLLPETREELKRIGTYRAVESMLNNEEELHNMIGILQNNVLGFRETYAEGQLDYTICSHFLYAEEYQTNEILSGERWFMYTMFQRVYRKEKQDAMRPYFNWFYLYLVLKANIRNELLQTNENVGFDNFSLFEKRKDVFVEKTPFEEIYLKMAVRDTLYNQNIVSLEARIAPKDSEAKLFEMITRYDKWITGNLKEKEAEKLKRKYFYVLHFIKQPERCKEDSLEFHECRHDKLRRKIKQQALALAELRRKGSEAAFRIKGIDAASAELWCRPEVFAQAFRYLKNHMIHAEARKWMEENDTNLMATYHVGEDFLDILDGLRAIDEAVCFLNLKCGERIGHALALGVDVDEWYEKKSNRIVINKIRYLDDLVWLYSKIKQYNVNDCNAVLLYIEKKFDEYFQEIFLNNMEEDKIKKVIQEAGDYYSETEVVHGYDCNNFSFNISVYYDAWKLRGDNPELYRTGYFRTYGNVMDQWDAWAVNKEFPVNYKIRYNPETAFLVYMYHFNSKVKATGDQMLEIKVNAYMRDVIKQVQTRYQQEIATHGIGIETNPSSNYRIGTFRRYDRHPIIRWYNLGLTSDQEKLQQCPQMKVSINTDDQGVFATSLENEYGCLALALEKSVDDQGNRRYNRTMIMQWLDNIRKMGINQSFYLEEN